MLPFFLCNMKSRRVIFCFLLWYDKQQSKIPLQLVRMYQVLTCSGRTPSGVPLSRVPAEGGSRHRAPAVFPHAQVIARASVCPSFGPNTDIRKIRKRGSLASLDSFTGGTAPAAGLMASDPFLSTAGSLPLVV